MTELDTYHGTISMRFAVAQLVFGLLLSAPAWSSPDLQTVVLSTQPAGWTPASSVIVGDVIPYSIADSGRVHFTGDLHGNYGAAAGYGIWSYFNGELTSILRSDAVNAVDGQPVKLATGTGAGAPTPTHAFVRGIAGSDSTGYAEGIWLAHDNVAQPIMFTGEQLPSRAEEWTGFHPASSASSANRLLFLTGTRQLDGTGPQSRQALWLADLEGGLQLVARENEALPGLSPGQTMYYIYHDSFALTKRGDAAFFANYTGATTTDIVGHGIWMRTVEGELHLLAQSGDVVDVFGKQISRQLLADGPLLNNRRQLLLRGNFESNDFSSRYVDGIWLQDADGSRRLVAHTGLGPDTNQKIVFGGFRNTIEFTNLTFFLNDRGKIAFPGSYYEVDNQAEQTTVGDQSNVDVDRDDVGPVGPSYRQAIWTEDNGELKVIAREGDILPGVDLPLVWAVPVALNNAGQLLFQGSMTPGIPTERPLDRALWAQDQNGEIHLIVKNGEQIDIAPGPEVDLRTVHNFLVPLTSNAPGGAVGFNDRGQILLDQ